MEIKIPICCLAYLLLEIQNVAEKWIMKTKFVNVHELLMFEGILGLLFTLVFGIILEVCFSDSLLFGNFKVVIIELRRYSQKGMDVFYFLIQFISSVFYCLFTKLIRYHYTPLHCCVSD